MQARDAFNEITPYELTRSENPAVRGDMGNDFVIFRVPHPGTQQNFCQLLQKLPPDFVIHICYDNRILTLTRKNTETRDQIIGEIAKYFFRSRADATRMLEGFESSTLCENIMSPACRYMQATLKEGETVEANNIVITLYPFAESAPIHVTETGFTIKKQGQTVAVINDQVKTFFRSLYTFRENDKPAFAIESMHVTGEIVPRFLAWQDAPALPANNFGVTPGEQFDAYNNAGNRRNDTYKKEEAGFKDAKSYKRSMFLRNLFGGFAGTSLLGGAIVVICALAGVAGMGIPAIVFVAGLMIGTALARHYQRPAPLFEPAVGFAAPGNSNQAMGARLGQPSPGARPHQKPAPASQLEVKQAPLSAPRRPTIVVADGNDQPASPSPTKKR